MQKRVGVLVLALAGGLLVLFLGITISLPGRDQFSLPAIAATLFLLSLVLSFRLAGNRKEIVVGAVLPAILFAAGNTDTNSTLYTVVACLGLIVVAVVGVSLGPWLSTGVPQWRWKLLWSLTGLSFACVGVMSFLAVQPVPIGNTDGAYVGRWVSDTGIEMDIQDSGICGLSYTCPIVDAKLGNLAIADIPGGPLGLQVAITDSALYLCRPVSFTMRMKIESSPHSQDGRTSVVIEGVRFTKAA
jgi:hypothetical protein